MKLALSFFAAVAFLVACFAVAMFDAITRGKKSVDWLEDTGT